MSESKAGGDIRTSNQSLSVVFPVLIAVSTIAIIIADWLMPLGYAIPLLYMIPLMLASAVPRLNLVVFSSIVTILIVVGFLLSPPGIAPVQAVFNRSLCVLVLWVLTVMLVRRRQDQQTLQRYERAYHALAIALDEGVVRLERGVGLTDWNPAAERILGLSRDQMQWLKDFDSSWQAIHEDGTPFSSETSPGSAALATGLSQIGVIMGIRTQGGALKWVSVNAVPTFDSPNSSPSAVVLSFSDITERKQAESAVMVERDRLAAVLRSIRDEVWFADTAGRFKLVNPQGISEFNLDESNLDDVRTLAASLEVLRADGSPRPVHEAPALRALRGELVTNEEEMIRTPANREFRYREVSAAPVRDDQGRIIGSVSVVRDITERKKAEDAMQAASQYVRSLIEASLDPLVTISADGKITDVNLATERVTGYGRDSLVGSDFADYFTDPQKARDGYQQVFSQGMVADYPLAIRHASGNVTDVLYNASLYRDAKGNVVGVFAAARDVTKANRLQESLRARNVELGAAKLAADKANLAKSEFLSSMSHELRTPLNAILGFAQLLEQSSVSPPAPSQKGSIDQILAAGWHLLELVNEILDLAQIESGRVSVSRQAVPLKDVMLMCKAMVEPLAEARGIGMSYAGFDVPHFVGGDAIRIRQVLINLIYNAIKYNKPAGTVAVECTLVPPSAIRISVRDTGPGLAAEQLAQLFQPFNRLGREASAEQGTGIGLVVSKRLVELMGGVIGADSTVGVGSVFWVELGLTDAPPLSVSEVEQAAQAKPQFPDGLAQRAVLYVEDNPSNQKLVEEIIKLRPELRMISAADGALGVEYARTFMPEVILMDLHLPGLSGIEAMKTLRADPRTAHIPVIALSADALPGDIQKVLDIGFFNCITKPIKLKEFMAALDVALEFSQRQSTRAAEKT